LNRPLDADGPSGRSSRIIARLRFAGITAPRCHTLLDQLTFRGAIVLSADRRAASRPQQA
jgi:hypothetical protein